eukprot:gb/GECG01003568.1/.p1 GENE.gb/GECG01003568.1/~~gb/GECG01003568.1/.p1  ORF type:complete len:247 (+),score=26.31 gb/GECG01003568.1/:1-741(+)
MRFGGSSKGMTVLTATLAVLAFVGTQAEGGCSGTDFDYMAIVEQWPPTAAKSFHKDSSNDYFTLHGVWPNDFNGDYPCNCEGSQFDPDKLKPIEDQLDKYWPSLKCEGDSCNDDFWEHEWSKHGTCAVANISSLDGQLDYFKKALQLRNQYDPLNAFQTANITPTNDHGYKYDDIVNALKNEFNVRTVLQCQGENDIDVIEICINKSFGAIDCPSHLQDTCDYDYEVWLPAHTESRRNLRATSQSR